jgi:hypothetical protein
MTDPVFPVLEEDYTFKYGSTGIVLNSSVNLPTAGNPIWDVSKVTGLDLPEIKTSDKEFDGIDGGTLDAENIKMRTITLEGALIAHQDDSLEVYLDLLKENYAPVPRDSTHLPGELVDRNTRPLYIKAPGVDERYVACKPIGLRYDWSRERRFNSAPFQIVLQAENPILYSPVLHSITIPAETDFVLYYAGNYPGHVIAVITGAATDISLDHIEAARQLSFNSGGNLTVGQSATINFRTRTAVKSTGASIRGAVFSEDWWRLAKGANTIRLNVGTGAPTLTLKWRDGWY